MATTGSKVEYVLAANYLQFQTWCRDNRLNPTDTRQVHFVRRPGDLRGLSADTAFVIKVGRWWMGRSYDEIQEFHDTIRVLEVVGVQVVTYIR